MEYRLKNILRPLVPMKLINFRKRFRREKYNMMMFLEWQKNGCPIPPPHAVKQLIINEYRKKYGYNIFVETGTFIGMMVEAQKTNFKKIISIELGLDLYEKAQKRFKLDKNVTLYQGDSGKVLPKIVNNIKGPAIFWLDGHYCGDITAKGEKVCPIFEELDAIFSTKYNHILLIDDARAFIGDGDYPTIEELKEYIKSKNEKYRVEVEYDIIRCVIQK